MAVDEALAASVTRGDSGPVVRVFGWSPPAVSFGYAQRVSREIDLEACARQGIGIVRRPTGGRAVLHWNELTYSVVCPADDPRIGGNIGEVYRAISECLVAGVRSLNVDAVLEPGRSPVPSPRGRDLTSPCFSSTSQYEVTLQGRKLIGSAQRRMGETVLQHGSLLIGPEHKRIIDLLPDRHARLKTRFREELEAHTLSLAEAGHGDLDFDRVARGIHDGFRERLGVDVVAGDLTAAERAEAEHLRATRYATDAWNFKDREPTRVTREIV